MDSVKQVLWQICCGAQGSIMGIFTMRNFSSSQRKKSASQQTYNLLKTLLYCFALNGVAFGFTTYAFYYLCLPCMKYFTNVAAGDRVTDTIWHFIQTVFSSFFNALWLAPMFLLSRVLNCILFQDVADIAFEMSSRHAKINLSLTALAADVISSVAVQTLFLIQSFIVALFPIPFVGNVLSFLHLCLLYSLYAFEYKWVNIGWPLHKRLAFIDCNWPYFLGFGFPLALLTMMSTSYIADLCIFSVLFPLYIISGTNSIPIISESNYSLHIFVPVIYCWNFCTGSVIQKPVIKQN